MGSASSKITRSAGATARRYPSRPGGAPQATTTAPSSSPTPDLPRGNAPIDQVPPGAAPESATGPSVHPAPRASSYRSDAINQDAADPDLLHRLQQVGPVQPSPTYSSSSTSSPTPATSSQAYPTTPAAHPGTKFPSPSSNPTLAILAARERIEKEAEEDRTAFGRPGFAGRRFVDAATLRKVLVLRDEGGMSAEAVEARLGLKSGVVSALGRKGLVEAA